MKEKKGLSKTSKRSERSESSEDESLAANQLQITIEIESIENIETFFPAADVYIIVQHQSKVIGQTDPTYILDKNFTELKNEIKFHVNVMAPKGLDTLLTYPLYFVVWQSQNKLEYENLDLTTNDLDYPGDEILSVQEMILGVKERAPDVPPRPKSVKHGQKLPKSPSPKSPKSKESPKPVLTKLSSSSESLIEDPFCCGSGTVDLLPLVQGQTEICEIVPIYQKKLYIDDRFKHGAICPQLRVKVKTEGSVFDLSGKTMTNMFQLSMEALYNLPDDINETYEIKLATVFPTEQLNLQQFYFERGIFKNSEESVGLMKFWPNLSTVDNLGTQTKQIIEADLCSLKNKTDIPVENILNTKPPRIVWNSIKRSWLNLDANEYLRQLITKFRNWPIEIKLTPMRRGQSLIKVDKKKIGDKKSVEGLSVGHGKKSKISMWNQTSYHFMTFADISTLLYPGVTKTRVVCPVYNYCQNELLHNTGYEGSCFSQYAKSGLHMSADEAEGKSPNAKEDKSSKSSKDKKKKTKDVILPQEEICETELVRSSSGTCFLIIEAELMFPFMKRRTIYDLTDELMTIIPRRPPLPKSVIPMRLAVNMYKTTICELTREINQEFQHFTQEYDMKHAEITTPLFIKFLQEKGTYQKFLMTVGQSISLLVKEKFKYTEEQQTEYMYDNYISMIYVYLINEMNKQINSIMNCNVTGCSARKFSELDYLYLCDEAIELDIPILAEKYHLQIMKDNHRSADHWFNLALFYKSQKFNDRAYECCKEGLALKPDHKLCLLLFGGMLYERQDYLLAETTLLAIVNHYPECLEAWVGLFIVYYHKTKYEGCDICMEHINKYKNKVVLINTDPTNLSNGTEDPPPPSHEQKFKKYEPLSWSTQIAAKTPFFHCAVTFIKMHVLQFAEQSLLFDKVEQTGEHKYYLGVIKYFQKDYSKALKVLNEAQKEHGPDYAVNSMIGHCNYRLGKFDEAKEAYEFIVCAYNRPEDMHMLYTNLALIYEKENNLESARKYLLLVCKMSPTPYSWLLLGIIFFKEDRLKEAESCVTESNNLDNRLPETWAYLVLINIKLGKIWEAQQCFSQMMKYDLQDKSLLALVVIEMKMAKQSTD